MATRIIANESALEKKLLPGMLVIVCFAGVDQVGIDLIVRRKGADAEQAVFPTAG